LNSEYIIRLKKKIQKHGMNPMRQGVDLFTGWKLKGRRKKKVVQLAMVRAIPLLHLLNFSVS
jgi:hypothetical protein